MYALCVQQCLFQVCGWSPVEVLRAAVVNNYGSKLVRQGPASLVTCLPIINHAQGCVQCGHPAYQLTYSLTHCSDAAVAACPDAGSIKQLLNRPNICTFSVTDSTLAKSA